VKNKIKSKDTCANGKTVKSVKSVPIGFGVHWFISFYSIFYGERWGYLDFMRFPAELYPN
jgi:hypothetical protein